MVKPRATDEPPVDRTAGLQARGRIPRVGPAGGVLPLT
jgi:hypothetical protein